MVNQMETNNEGLLQDFENIPKGEYDLSWALNTVQQIKETSENITDWWEEYKCVSGKIKEVYPIKTANWEPGHYGIIVEADSGNPGDWASEAYRGRDYSEFKAWQKVWHITYKRERPATDEEKEYFKKRRGTEIETTVDWVYVTVPYWANKNEYLRKALLADQREKEERARRVKRDKK
jgi:hypothetical protein